MDSTTSRISGKLLDGMAASFDRIEERRQAYIDSLAPCDGDTPQQKAQKELDLISLRAGAPGGSLVASEDGKTFKMVRPTAYAADPVDLEGKDVSTKWPKMWGLDNG